MVCQTLCLRRRLFDREKNNSLKNKVSQLPEARISCLFGQVLNLRPKHILPVTNCVGNTNQRYVQDDAKTEWQAEADKSFGPITVEEVRMLFCRHNNL